LSSAHVLLASVLTDLAPFAWPLLIALFGVVFYVPLRRLLDRISHAKVKDVEFHFGTLPPNDQIGLQELGLPMPVERMVAILEEAPPDAGTEQLEQVFESLNQQEKLAALLPFHQLNIEYAIRELGLGNSSVQRNVVLTAEPLKKIYDGGSVNLAAVFDSKTRLVGLQMGYLDDTPSSFYALQYLIGNGLAIGEWLLGDNKKWTLAIGLVKIGEEEDHYQECLRLIREGFNPAIEEGKLSIIRITPQKDDIFALVGSGMREVLRNRQLPLPGTT
jgi:hypothetical protein